MAKRVRFVELLKRHEREIYRFAYRMTGRSADAADVLQETFMRAFRAFPRLPDDADHRAWLYRIAANQSLNHLRNERRRRSVPLNAAADLPHPDGSPAVVTETRRLERALQAVVETLPPRQRMALLLRKQEGLGYGEVARAMRCTEVNARAHVSQAMKKVRRALRDRSSS